MEYRFVQVPHASFEEMLTNLLKDYKPVQTPVRMVVFGAVVDNEEYVRRFLFLKKYIRRIFGKTSPLISYVAQPPYEDGLTMEVHEALLTQHDKIEYHDEEGRTPYIIIKKQGSKQLFLSGVQGDILRQTIREQSHGIFSKIAEIMENESMPISSIIRQWNYIEKITAYDANGYQHYQEFNEARSLFYKEVEWLEGYPAATGIGMQWGGILVDLDALYCRDEGVRVYAVNNPLQVAAHTYSQKVLLGKKDEMQLYKTTPKFERGKAVWKCTHGIFYISGTAAIRDEQSLGAVGIEKQTLITLENIEYLASRENLDCSGIPVTRNAVFIILRVYVKYWEDMEQTKRIIKERYPDLPVIYTLADICRSELLVEIEGTAILC